MAGSGQRRPSQLGHRVILVHDAYEWADDVIDDRQAVAGLSPTTLQAIARDRNRILDYLPL
jgi:hypothetical protein